VGFRGKDAVYLLHEPARDLMERFRQAKIARQNESLIELESVSTDHRSLGTFRRRNVGAGLEGRSFGLGDLQNVGKLAAFSVDGNDVPIEDVRGALSVITCLTIESGRMPCAKIQNRPIYNHARVRAHTAMQSYNKAMRITKYAEVFPNHVLADRIEKLEKRARELDELILSAQKAWGSSKDNFQRKEFLDQAISGKAIKETARPCQRIKDIAAELRVQQGEKLAEIISLCSNADAVLAAKSGVTMGPKMGRV